MKAPQSILVTGVNGFVGHHLCKRLYELGHKAIGVGSDEGPTEKNRVFLDAYIESDLTEMDAVELINLDCIDSVIHLAALSNIGMSFEKPAEFIGANTAMVANLMQHALDQKSKATFVVISTGAVYDSSQSMPITETEGVISHSSPYTISKVATEYLCDYYRSRGLRCIVTRAFNHVGPGQGPGFLLPDLALQLQKIKAEKTKEIVVGNLTTSRDYTDVRDVVNAYIALATSDKMPEESIYNVCSGESHSGEEILQLLTKAYGFSASPRIRINNDRFRPNDPKDIYGSNRRLYEEFGWRPTIPLDQTIKDFVADFAQ